MEFEEYKNYIYENKNKDDSEVLMNTYIPL
jgi:hypothetical protein